ncbi:MAG: hypothetical protein WKG06_09480 [Segetibacter sp.]
MGSKGLRGNAGEFTDDLEDIKFEYVLRSLLQLNFVSFFLLFKEKVPKADEVEKELEYEVYS